MHLRDEVLDLFPAEAFTESVITQALALELLSCRQIVQIEMRRMEAGIALSEREERTALRLRDELREVEDDWFAEPPINLSDLPELLDSETLRVLTILFVSSYGDQLGSDDSFVWELESIFSMLDVDGRFGAESFLAPPNAESLPYETEIERAVEREALALRRDRLP